MALEGKAKATIANYLRAPLSLMLHCNKLPKECAVDQIKAFLIHQRYSLNYGASTVIMRACGLKHYFRNVSIRPNLVVVIPNPRIQKFQTEVLTSEKLKTLYCSCKDMRQSIVISLMYECGLRSHEVVRLRIGDFNNEHRSITIRNSKGNKTLVAPYSHSLRDDLKKYCKATDATPPCTLIE